MPRAARLTLKGREAIYHTTTRTCFDNNPFTDLEKDEMFKIIIRYSQLYFTEIIGICIMGTHIHLLIKMIPGNNFSKKEIKKRFVRFYGKEKKDLFETNNTSYYREKWSKLSDFMKDIKQTFTRFYNKRHNRKGILWGERFKSEIIEKGDTLINCLAYIDLNPIRKDIVKRPEEYRWSLIGYHIQTKNKENFLSFDFGLNKTDKTNKNKRVKKYLEYLYEEGAIDI